MRRYALSAIGRDRPGIVAEVTRVLLERRVNIEDSQATILGGQFAMTLILAAPDDVDAEALRDELAGDLDGVSLSPVEGSGEEPDPSHIVTVYGVDHPGIVHAVAAALAQSGANITDLNTRLVPEEGEPLYALMLEVTVPGDVDELRGALEEAAGREGVEVSLRELEADAL